MHKGREFIKNEVVCRRHILPNVVQTPSALPEIWRKCKSWCAKTNLQKKRYADYKKHSHPLIRGLSSSSLDCKRAPQRVRILELWTINKCRQPADSCSFTTPRTMERYKFFVLKARSWNGPNKSKAQCDVWSYKTLYKTCVTLWHNKSLEDYKRKTWRLWFTILRQCVQPRIWSLYGAGVRLQSLQTAETTLNMIFIVVWYLMSLW